MSSPPSKTGSVEGTPGRPGGSLGWRRRLRSEAAYGYYFLGPAYVLFFVFLAGPLAGAIVLSLFGLTIAGRAPVRRAGQLPPTRRRSGCGQRHHQYFRLHVLVDRVAHRPRAAVGLGRQPGDATGIGYFLRTTIFFPMLVSWAAVALIWNYILDPNFGFVTHYLAQLGLPAPNFLIEPNWAMPAIIFVDLWKTLGFTFIILLAGLQGIPAHLYEAALVDGAGVFRRSGTSRSHFCRRRCSSRPSSPSSAHSKSSSRCSS